jgi:ribose 1,5-bisphosphokinase PhnN
LARLATRERGSDGDLAARIARSANLKDACQPDHVIHNVDQPIAGIHRLLNLIRNP